MRILVTNDDGIDSQGLLALKTALAEVGEVTVIAPDRNWSVAGHSKTMDRPLRVTEVELRDGSPAFSTDGTPSDCVALGLLGLLPRRPHLVVSGINKGANLGDDITYSGTVAAAMEAIVAGLPAIAVSQEGSREAPAWEFGVAATFAARLARQVCERGIPSEVLLNVNVPNLPGDRIQGVAITRLGKRIYRDELVERKDPFGRTYYWIGGEVPAGELQEGTDLKAVADGSISVTPIHLDLTNHRVMEALQQWHLTW